MLNHILCIHRSSSYLSQTESCQGLPLKSILLPSKLEVFTYLGFSLFLGEVKHNLHELPSFTKVTLHIDNARHQSFCLPQLPLGLQHLVLAEGTHWCWPDTDWSGVYGCAGLQHLTLGIGQQLSGQLKQWVRSARCLYVVDQSGECEQSTGNLLSELQASRLPHFVDLI